MNEIFSRHGNNKGITGRARRMNDGRASFNEMLSVDEYWTRAIETDRSELKTSSSDDSTDQSDSSGKSYRDAICYVDFENEFNKIVAQKPSRIVEDSRKIIHLSDPGIEDNSVKVELSRYVRWNVLMSLGLGLWIVLCILDGLQSEKLLTTGWFVELTRKRKNFVKIVSMKRPETYVWWFFNFPPLPWTIIWVSSYAGVCITLIMLFIVLLTEPKLQTADPQSALGNNTDAKISTLNEIENSIAEHKTLNYEKSPNSRVICPIIREIVPVKLVPSSAINLRMQVFFNVEQRFSNSPTVQICYSIFQKRIASVPTMLQSDNHCQSKHEKSFTFNRKNVSDKLYITNCEIMKLTNVRGKDANSTDGTSTAVTFVDSSNSTCGIQKIYFKVQQFFKKTKKPSCSLNPSQQLSIPSRQNATESSNNGEPRMRMITSSPDFENFLSRLKHNSFVS